MTDEEKAEEYVDKILSDSKYPFIFNKEKVKAYIIKVYLDSLKVCEEAYNKGLAEGRKEIEQWKQEWQDAQIKANEEGFARTTLQIKCTNLEKEIEEQKDRNVEIEKILEKANSELSKESLNCMELSKVNEELKKDKEYLDKVNNEQTEVILKLQEQIEQLSNDNHVLKTSFITQQEQIEKMKCCMNCKKMRTCLQYIKLFKLQVPDEILVDYGCIDGEKWECIE